LEELTEATVALLERRGAAALSLEEVREILRRDRDGIEIPEERLLSELRGGRAGTVRILQHPGRRWAHAVGPRAWILFPRASIDPGGMPRVLPRLRATIAALGMQIEPGSTRAWARWTRLLEEEAAARRALRSRARLPPATS
jgi:hypothetical protein